MNRYEMAVTSCVRQAVAEKLSAEQINTPLVEQLAVILAGTAEATGARIDDLVEIVRHQLDQRVAHHVNQIRSR